MHESFEQDNLYKATSRQREEQFVPVDEIPDITKLNPLEALIAKETPEEEEDEVQNGHVDPNDITRAPSYLQKKFDDTESLVQPPVFEAPEAVTDIVDSVENSLLNEKERITAKLEIHESHGVRGRVPRYKNHTGPKLNSVEGELKNN